MSIDWRPFSLAVVNNGDEARRAPDSSSAPALRLLTEIRRRAGNKAAGDFYSALASARHEHGVRIDEPDALRSALRDAGADPSLLTEVLADPATWVAVLAEHDAAVADLHAFGVPTIVLSDGAVMFGPIIVELPDDAESLELWKHFSWLTRNGNFAELKRGRSGAPVFEDGRREPFAA